MSNTYFRFKQFTIQQHACAMKVCTDACLFGAWVAQKMQIALPATALDIGTGTGLLSLMAAQQNKTRIDAVEVDAPAAQQAAENFDCSPWKDRLRVFNNSVQDFTQGKTYGFIFSNPPFFENDLQSSILERNIALHSQQLTMRELIDSITRLLAPEGSVALLVAANRSLQYETALNKAGYFLIEKVQVHQTNKHDAFRCMLLFDTNPQPCHQSEIIIKQNGQYSAAFTALLKDYYLYL